jgi:two-component system, LytTR family, response regulator
VKNGKKFRVLIVDDEALAREGLRRQLMPYQQLEIIGEADSVESAARLVEQFHPDVVFLDIQMPGESGFNLLARVENDFKVIFVTAFDNYAIRAFEVNALDYLLKPLSPARIADTIARLDEEAHAPVIKEQLSYDDYIFIDDKRRSKFIKVADILYITSAGDYSDVYLKSGEKYMLLKAMREWEAKLPGKSFLRIHRSIIINLNYVEKTEPGFKNTFQIYLANIPQPFTSSRKYAQELKKKFSC